MPDGLQVSLPSAQTLSVQSSARTLAPGMQDPSLSFDALYEQAAQARPLLEAAGRTILDDLRQAHPGMFDDAFFQMGKQKTPDRAMGKIAGDYEGRVFEISDLTRGRLVVHTPEQVQAVRAYLAEGQLPLSIEKMNDRFAKPSDTNFRDINTKARLDNGHVAEFRVEQADMIVAGDSTHKPYERAQAISRGAEQEGRMMSQAERLEYMEIMDHVRDIHGAPAAEHRLDVLLDDKGRAKVAAMEAEHLPPSIGAAEVGPASVPTSALVPVEVHGPAGGASPTPVSAPAASLAETAEQTAALAAKTVASAPVEAAASRSLVQVFGAAAKGALEHAPVIGAAVAIGAGAAETTYAFANGDYRGAAESAGATVGALAGGIAGAEAGAAGGALVGSVVPVIGTAIGGIAGGLLGGIAGGLLGGWGGGSAGQVAYDAAHGPTSAFTQAAGATPAQIDDQQKGIIHRSGLDTVEQSGKPVDTLAVLRDPAKCSSFIETLEHSAASATDPDKKAGFAALAQAAKDVSNLEDKRQTTIAAQQQPATPAPTTSPSAPSSQSWASLAAVAPMM